MKRMEELLEKLVEIQEQMLLLLGRLETPTLRRVAPTKSEDALDVQLTEHEKKVADAIISDPTLNACVVKPNALAQDLVKSAAKGVDVVTEVLKMGEWLRGPKSKGGKRNGNRFAMNWIRNSRPQSPYRNPPPPGPRTPTYKVLNPQLSSVRESAEHGAMLMQRMIEE